MPTRTLSQFAVIVALFISGVSLDLQAVSALASDCLAAPNTSAPQGQHWYYRIDRTSHRKCWYLHANLPVLHRAVITRVERYRPPASTTVAASRDLAEGAPSLPEFRTFAERLHSVLSANATSEGPLQQIAREETDPPSIPPQSTADSARPDTGRFIASDAEGAAERGDNAGKTGTAGALRLILLLLVPGLAIAGFLVPVLVRVVSRRPIDVPETAWIEHQSLHDRSSAGGQQKRQDQGHGSCLAESREQSATRPHRIKESPSVLSRRSKTRSQHLAAAAKSLGQNAEGIERALRAIRQARQQRTA